MSKQMSLADVNAVYFASLKNEAIEAGKPENFDLVIEVDGEVPDPLEVPAKTKAVKKAGKK